ncbi:unnamed protein product [Brachionus calyciflorus]|uniref:Tc1-like transposase DDE domain-containing protein n=1 Tax=Brachionus calyciflorus TaxID=104777 RepID=A0A813W3Y3_9BILA|nr:unnamed protein product [Brachionus calyciflorus]
MDSKLYNEILSDFLLPFGAINYDFDYFLHQDNDPKHKSSECRSFLEKNGINWIRSPPRSPDLNPIEMLWHEMKAYVRKFNCTTDAEIAEKVIGFQRNLTPERCQKYIDRLKKACL